MQLLLLANFEIIFIERKPFSSNSINFSKRESNRPKNIYTKKEFPNDIYAIAF